MCIREPVGAELALRKNDGSEAPFAARITHTVVGYFNSAKQEKVNAQYMPWSIAKAFEGGFQL